MIKRLLLTICLLATTIFMCTAQPSWQWGKRGGSSDASGSSADEKVVDMATDQHGNIYVLSKILQTGANIDGHAVAEYGGYDISISSFKCDGTFRWSKTIGGGGDDLGTALKTDTFGGVYVTGYVLTHFITIHIDADSSWGTPTTYQSFFVAKFDTGGAYKWFRMPQADTVGSGALSYTYPFDMDVDGSGNIYILCELPPGIFGGAYVVSGSTGIHMLKYDRYGNFVGGLPLDMTVSGVPPNLKMKRDHQLRRYYITGAMIFGGGPVTVGGVSMTHSLFAACFNNSGIHLWCHQDTDPVLYSSNFGRPSVDFQHNIYLGGRTSNADTFNGYTMVNGGSSAVPLIIKLDTNGTNIWAKNATVNGATFSNTIIVNGSEVDLAGQNPGKLKWAGYPDSLNLPSGSGYHIFITRFDAATGIVIKLDSLASTAGNNNDATAMAADIFGNFYIGGDFSADITVNGSTLSSAGGGSDFFIAKYGTSNCNAGTLGNEPSEPAVVKSLRVYPNPASEELVIENAINGSPVKLLNVMGQEVHSGVVANDHFVVSTRSLVNGMYILQVTDAAGNRTARTIVKQ